MLKTFTFVLLAVSMSAGVAQARVAGVADPTKYFHHCPAGRVTANCNCQAAGAPGRHQICRAGQYCHPFDGVCTQ